MFSKQTQVSNERYEIISKRYAKFQETMIGEEEPVKVFDPLSQKHKDELILIREVSKDLQKKKDDDINKAELAQAEAETKEVEEAVVESAVKEDA